MKYAIYQLDSSKESVRKSHKMFESWALLNEYCGGFDFSDYKKVYESEVDDNVIFGVRVSFFLDYLFEKFNTTKVLDFQGHSLSVSDVVWLEDKDSYYFCDSRGWRQIDSNLIK